jgi:hypothetical protein
MRRSLDTIGQMRALQRSQKIARADKKTLHEAQNGGAKMVLKNQRAGLRSCDKIMR